MIVEDIQEIHKFTSDDKLKWCGYGEWVEEPDEVLFVHEGIKCRIIRIIAKDGAEHIFGGHLCGYICIPKTHFLYGKKYDDYNIDVHGGLTYSQLEADDEYWIGFDCGHSGDFIPSMEFFRKTNSRLKEFEKQFPVSEEFKHLSIFNPTYKNIAFCIGECKSMAEQLNLIDDK